MKRGSDETTQQPSKTPRIPSREKRSSANREPVHVFCRLRPLHEDLEFTCVKLLSSTTLTLAAESKTARRECNYVFRHIFTSYSGQQEVFRHVALPLLEDLIEGKSGLLFTYGVTGSGKTFTLTGDQNNPGVMPRCIDTLFNTIENYQTPKFLIKSDRMNGFEIQSESDAREERCRESKINLRKARSVKKSGGDVQDFYANDGAKIQNVTGNSRFAVFISYIEIYNNVVYDLLDESNGKTLLSKLLREASQKNMYVNGLVELEVKSAAEAFELFSVGQKRKRMGHTALNSESSRSHSIFTIRVVQLETATNSLGQPMIPDRNLLKVGQLNLVDLAGSERCSRTQNTGMRLKEASSINNSLMSLRTCLEILRENQLTGGNRLVPYRDSRLTLLFKNYFEGEGQVRMIVCVNPSAQDCEENLQVMKFAEMTQDVKVPKSEVKYTPYRTKTPKTTKGSKSVYTPATLKAKKNLSFAFGPRIPNIKFGLENPEENLAFLDNLLKIVHLRKQKGDTVKRDVILKEEHFRKRLLRLNQENILNQSEINNIKVLLKKQKQTSKNLENKVTHLEIVKDSLEIKNKDLEQVIQTLQCTVEEKNLKINQNLLEKEKSKQKFALQSAKASQELEEKLRKQRQHLQAALISQDAKFKKVKEIIDCDDVPIAHSTPEMERKFDYEPQQTPPLHRRDINRALRQRRSRSADDKWLEHNVIKPVPLGTIFQPSMKKRKSVTKLDKAKDVINTKQNKYCLIAQETDADGEVETKLYKADIVPTCGGGAQVIFNDVEKLRQESPSNSPAIVNGK